MRLSMQDKDSLLNIAVDICEELEGWHRIIAFSRYLEMQQNFYCETEDASESFLKAFVDIAQLYKHIKEKRSWEEKT